MNPDPNGMITSTDGKKEMSQQEIDQAVAESELLLRNFVSCQGEPAFTFSRLKIGVNTACVRKVMNRDYIQILINQQKKLLIVRPCDEDEIHSFQWSVWKDGKKHPRQITAKIFYMKVYAMMGWNPEDRYRIIGKVIHSNGQEMIFFDLSAGEKYEHVQPAEGKKARASRTPIYPMKWRDQFGIPFEGHQKLLQINLFDGYAIYSVNGSLPDSPVRAEPPPGNLQSRFISQTISSM